ncbi:hypothetical protein QCM77_31045 [Bradyrhizobium sp. SSUT18]|nr:hypothetical protein [Bradyrhizobium sp. SSUT18]MDH2404356.1 hypothetical protein [Bradyrhizobium sp. SSUT18]
MRSATLFALGLLSVGVWLLGSARGQSVAPPISLAPPSTEQGAANSAWPPMAAPKAPPPRATAKNSRPPAKPNGEPSSATNNALPSGASEVSSAPLMSGPPPSPKPVTDYDGFSAGTVDDADTSGQVARPIRSRAAKASKPSVETSGATGQKSVDQEDEVLKRKLTICRDCK